MKGPARRSSCSEFLLLWCASLVRRGLRSIPGSKDVPELPERLRSRSLPLRQAEKLVADGRSLLQVVRFCFPRLLPLGLLLGIVQGFLSTVVRTLLLRWLVGNIAEGRHSPKEQGLAVLGLGLTLLLEGVTSTVCRHLLSDQLGYGFFGMAAVLIQRKSLRLSMAGKTPSTTALVGNDLIRTVENMKMMAFTPMGISQVICGSSMVLWLTGLGGLVGLSFVALLVLSNMWIMRRVKRVEKASLAAVDVRMELMKQMIMGMKAIKLSAWEEPFLAQLKHARDVECISLRRYRILLQSSTQIGRVCPIVGAAVCFLVLGMTGSTWQAADVFAALSVWHGMRMGFIQIPATLAQGAAVSAAAERVRAFLLLPERGMDLEQAASEDASTDHAARSCGVRGPWLEEARFGWGGDGFSFRPLTLSLTPGLLTGLAGSVGSGKSSLLLALLGELPILQGRRCMSRCEAVAYIPQTPVIVCGTVTENVLMGRPMDKSRFDHALRAAALEHDLASMSAGTETQIGEHGVMLSGGQQMRVGIARALYGDSALLLADDPLAAVDAEVARQIFDSGFVPFVRGRADRSAVIVFNQPHLLEKCDRVLLLREGKVTELPPQSQGELSSIVHASSIAEEEAHCATGQTSDTTATGSISASVLLTYLRNMGWCTMLTAVLICVSTYTAMAGADRLLARWLQEGDKDGAFALAYGVLCLVFTLCAVGSSFLFAIGGVRAGRALHHECLGHVMHAPLGWFEQTPSGRVISRFSSDLANVDLFLPYYYDNSWQFACTLLALFVTVCLLVPPLVVVMLVGVAFYGILVVAVDRTNRECKRLANLAMAPVLTAVQEAMVGRVLLRCMSMQSFATERFDDAVDEYKRLSFASSSVVNFGMLCSYAITVVISSCTAISIVVDPGHYGPERAGLALSYSLTIPYFLLFFSFNITHFTLNMASLERLLQYKGLAVPQEASWYEATDAALPKSWPSQGQLELQSVDLRYRPDLPLAVRSLSLTVLAGEKLGVVGRSGAGKSSLVQLVFRLRECSGGRILLDGQDIALMGLQTLRRRLAVIPQEPLLIAGDVRKNLDPFGTSEDAALQDIVSSIGLAAKGCELQSLSRDSATLSGGEQQLLTLARAMARQTVLMIMDEPTSKVDMEADALVQRFVRDRLPEATVITIAHRLHTVMHFDRILVMHDGALKECATPSELLANPDGELRRLVEAHGEAVAAQLSSMARGGAVSSLPDQSQDSHQLKLSL